MTSAATRLAPARFVAAMVIAEMLGMLGISAFPALLPDFARAWQLSATEAGWISGIYYAGYVISVPLLTAATDRVDPRRIYLACTALGGIANLGFALTADGFWSALVWQFLSGVGLAGTYMPGLKALTDRIGGLGQSRALASYTAGFSLGIGASFLLAGWVGPAFGWATAWFAAAAGSLAAIAIGVAVLEPMPTRAPSVPDRHLLDFRPVFANRAAMGFIVAYGCHNWELFGLRAWVVAFLTASAALGGEGVLPVSATWVASVITLWGIPCSIGGNELALRFGRRRMLPLVMAASGAIACAIGFTAGWSYGAVALLCIFYSGFVMADSASLTAGTVESAAAGARGATMAVHSSVGFLGAFLGPLLFGMVLDAGGGPGSRIAWGLGFASLGLAVASGALALLLLRPRADPTNT